MKKLISILLVLVLIVSLTAVSDLSIRAVEKEYQYESAFQNYAAEHGYKDFTYEEIDSGEHWTLVYAACEGNACDKLIKGVFGDRVIIGYDDGQPFDFGYGVFWRRVGFCPLTEVWNNPYFEGLKEMFRKYTDTILTNDDSTVWLLGDTDRDGKLTIIDATHIQKRLANLEPVPFYDSLPQTASASFGADIRYLSDIDRDGVTSVLDATLIQKRLASAVTDQELEFKVLANETTSSAAEYFKGAQMITSYEQLKEKKEWFSEEVWNDVLLGCDETFFKDHMLLMYTDIEGSAGLRRENFRVYRDMFCEINFEHDMVYPDGGSAAVLTNRLILLALNRAAVPALAGVNTIVYSKSAAPSSDDSYLSLELSEDFNQNAFAVNGPSVSWKESYNGNETVMIEDFEDMSRYGVMALLSSRAQYEAFMRGYGGRNFINMHPDTAEDYGAALEDIYDDAFFEDYSLVAVVYRYVCGNYTTKIIATATEGDRLYVALRTTNVPEEPHAAPIYSYNISVNMVKKTETDHIQSLGLLLMREETD